MKTVGGATVGRAAAIAAAVLLADLLWPSRLFNYDGVACALAVLGGDFKTLVHGNHLIYGLVGAVFHGILEKLGAGWGPLASLQLLSRLLGAISIAGLWLLLRWLYQDGRVAAGGALVAASASWWWLWRQEAQVYPLGFAFILAAFAALLIYARTGRIELLYAGAAAHAGAVMSHVGHVMFLPAGLYLAAQGARPGAAAGGEPDARSSGVPVYRVGAYLLTAGGLVLAAYGVIIALILGLTEPTTVVHWFLGNAAGPGGGVAWHAALGGGWQGPGDSLVAWRELFWGRPAHVEIPIPVWAAAVARVGTGVSRMLLAALALVGFLGIGRLRRDEAGGAAVNAAILWMASYAALYMTWEPHNPVYRLTDLIPIATLLCAAARDLERTEHFWTLSPRAALLIAGVALAAASWTGTILPFSDDRNNLSLQHSRFIRDHTAADDLILHLGEGPFYFGKVYIPYFGLRENAILSRYAGRADDLRARVETARARGGRVWVTRDAVEDSAWRDALGELGRMVTGPEAYPYALWELLPPAPRFRRGGGPRAETRHGEPRR